MQEAKPPLRVEEVKRVLGLLGPLSEEAQIVLVGGQALAFWSARFAEPDGEVSGLPARTSTSRDQRTPRGSPVDYWGAR